MTTEEARHRAHLSWSVTRDRSARTAAARRGLDAKFERQARDTLGDQATDRQIADAAESARRAYYLELAASGRRKTEPVRVQRRARNVAADALGLTAEQTEALS